MFSHFVKVWHWLAESLFPQKVELSAADEREAMAKALKLLNLIKAHKFAEALENGTKTIKFLVSPATLEKAFKDLQATQGQLVSFTAIGVEGIGSKKAAKVLVKFEKGELVAVIAIDSAGLIAGFRLKPAKDVPFPWKQPEYTDPSIFSEEEITLSANDIKVGATLSLPKSKPTAGVVLLAGSGPTDGDSTLGPNKPLKDLAWGLASNGVAVCRWDKPSAETSNKVTDENITLEKEYLPSSLAAIKALRERLAVSDAPIFVLGHRLGGIVAPLVGNADPSIKGLLMLSAAGGKMYASGLRQMQYLVSLNHEPPFATQEYVDLFSQQVVVIESPDFNAKSEKELPFGAPASYWLSVKEYDQIGEVQKLDIPVSILQPGRDYQVTVDDDLVMWKEGLEGKENVDIKVYEGLNHLFLAGNGPSTPEDYALEGHVDEAVVADICEWIKKIC